MRSFASSTISIPALAAAASLGRLSDSAFTQFGTSPLKFGGTSAVS
jgi:hypothetical protein